MILAVPLLNAAMVGLENALVLRTRCGARTSHDEKVQAGDVQTTMSAAREGRKIFNNKQQKSNQKHPTKRRSLSYLYRK
jgi:hypothetical protein